MKIKSDVVLKKGPHGWEAWQTNKLIAKVHGFDEGAKEEVMKHIPGYENVIESGVDIMNGYERNADSVNKIFNSREIKSGLFSYTLEDVRDSINRYLERNVINKSICKSNNPKEAEDVKNALLDLRENINNAIENGTPINEDSIYQTMNVCKKILWDRNYLQLLQDIINPLFESIGGNVPDTTELWKTVNNKKSFTPEEIDSLYEGIVNTGDDRFYKWLYETYPWITQDNAVTMNLESFMLQWVYNTPGIYEEMREWLDYWKDE